MSAKILIIDDEPDMLDMLEMIITDRTAYEVVTTFNPLELKDLISQNDFNLILTDLKMPIMDGFEVIDAVKKYNSDIPVVVITAFGTIEAAEEAVHRGAYIFITKPFRREQVLIAIDRALEWQRMAKENRELRRRLQEENQEP